MLGWKILKEGKYEVELRILSDDEGQLINKVDERFKEETRTKKVSNDSEASELLRGIISECAEENDLYLSSSQTDYLAEFALHHIYGYAFISLLLSDPAVEEISVIGIEKPAYVFIRNSGWKQVNACFTSEAKIAEIINKMASKIGRRITIQNPRLNAVLPDGSRLHASLPPISSGEITIRKFREQPFSPAELCTNETMSKESMVILSFLMQGDFSIVVAGNTASGKTTTLNSLFSFVPVNERIVLVEETPEINIVHPHQLRLVSNNEMGITLKDLVRDSLRMRPDRLVVGEVRNREEVEALFDVLLGGQARGSYATFHAQSAQEAIQRFKSFGINQADIQSIDAILIQRRMLNYDLKKRKNYEVRRVVELAELVGANAKPVFYRNSAGKLVLAKNSSLVERICNDLGLSKVAFNQEFNHRLSLLNSGKLDFYKYFSKIQKELYGLSYEID